jgi:hypothetical protein
VPRKGWQHSPINVGPDAAPYIAPGCDPSQY